MLSSFHQVQTLLGQELLLYADTAPGARAHLCNTTGGVNSLNRSTGFGSLLQCLYLRVQLRHWPCMNVGRIEFTPAVLSVTPPWVISCCCPTMPPPERLMRAPGRIVMKPCVYHGLDKARTQQRDAADLQAERRKEVILNRHCTGSRTDIRKVLQQLSKPK